MSLERRIARLEQTEERAQTWRNYQMVAAEFGFDAHELMDEAEEFFALSLEESDAQSIPWPEVDSIKATLTEHYQP
jgi:hypothetical protein